MAVRSPETMLAILHPNVQSPDLILATVPLPIPSPNTDEHLIQPNTKESTPIYDIAGTVIAAPPSSPFQPGAEIFARTNYACTGSGRQFTIAVTSELALKPKKLSWAEAATVPMSAQTARQALFMKGGLKPEAGTGAKGMRIYVTAASGGVGSWVVQLSKWAEAEITASCGADSIKRVRALGADELIDYRSVNVKDWAMDVSKKADLVVDCIGRTSLRDAWYVVKPAGTLISIFQPPEQMKPDDVDRDGIKNFFFIVEPLGSQLKMVTDVWEQADFVCALDSVYPLEKFEEAFAKTASGKAKGKVVLSL